MIFAYFNISHIFRAYKTVHYFRVSFFFFSSNNFLKAILQCSIALYGARRCARRSLIVVLTTSQMSPTSSYAMKEGGTSSHLVLNKFEYVRVRRMLRPFPLQTATRHSPDATSENRCSLIRLVFARFRENASHILWKPFANGRTNRLDK